MDGGALGDRGGGPPTVSTLLDVSAGVIASSLRSLSSKLPLSMVRTRKLNFAFYAEEKKANLMPRKKECNGREH